MIGQNRKIKEQQRDCSQLSEERNNNNNAAVNKKNTPKEEPAPAKFAKQSQLHVAGEASYISSFISQLFPWSLLGIVVFLKNLILYKYF